MFDAHRDNLSQRSVPFRRTFSTAIYNNARLIHNAALSLMQIHLWSICAPAKTDSGVNIRFAVQYIYNLSMLHAAPLTVLQEKNRLTQT